MIWIIFAAGLAETLPEKDQIVTSCRLMTAT